MQSRSGNDEERTAYALAHELGHNFGLLHDSGECICSPSCVMGPVVRYIILN